MVLEKAVQKLGLVIEKHPNPYKISWLKRGNEVTVSKCCLVSFSIELKYKDNAWCDVVVMDAFSLVDHGNMIERFNMMVGRIHTVSCLVAQKLCCCLVRRLNCCEILKYSQVYEPY